ncbi:uncharacterized protein LOC127208594 [Acomys russatus]|uniref:uncharacterized protein LOC127208594 n=1 Tax=Acomys russatus TaxID=60746 RepID=UPI0021E2D34C|nr:uncharacterized protein LOC127208594 [Acomys russatus]
MLSSTQLSQKTVDLEEMRSGGLGRCTKFFWLGVAFDAVGVAVLFTGVFADLLFYDMLLYLGSIIIFVSLLWWISWYTGNIEALPEEPFRRTLTRRSEVSEQRSGSRRFSLTLRNVSNTFLRIRRRRRRRLLPRALLRVSSLSSTDPGQLERNSDARRGDGRTSFHPEKPRSVLSKLELCAVQASRSFPLVPLHPPLSISTSRSQPVFSVTSQCYPPASEASESSSRMALSSESHVPVDSPSQEHSKISVASEIYPLEREDSQSHLLVLVPSDNLPTEPVTSQGQIQSSVSSESQVPVDSPSQEHSKISVTSEIYPLEREDSQSHLFVLVPSDNLPMEPVTSQGQIQASGSHVPVDSPSEIYPLEREDSQSSVSSESHVPVDSPSQGRSKICVATQIYPLEREDSQTSQSQIQDTAAQRNRLQKIHPAS